MRVETGTPCDSNSLSLPSPFCYPLTSPVLYSASTRKRYDTTFYSTAVQKLIHSSPRQQYTLLKIFFLFSSFLLLLFWCWEGHLFLICNAHAAHCSSEQGLISSIVLVVDSLFCFCGGISRSYSVVKRVGGRVAVKR